MGNTKQAQEAAGEGAIDDETGGAAAQSGEGAVTDESSADAGEGGGAESSDDLPEWARERISKANREAASYRSQLRDLQERTKEYKTVEEFNSAMSDLASRLAEKDRELIAERYRIDDDMREFIVGETAEEWEASAKKLSERLSKPAPEPTPPPTQTPPSGSRKREAAASTDSPAEAALRALKRR